MLWTVEFQSVRGFRVFAVFGEEGAIERKSGWETLFDVEDPRTKVPQCKGKFIDVNQALEVARFDIQYCDWRARQDVLAIMLLHEKVPSISCYCIYFFYCSVTSRFFPRLLWFIFLLETCFVLKIP